MNLGRKFVYKAEDNLFKRDPYGLKHEKQKVNRDVMKEIHEQFSSI